MTHAPLPRPRPAGRHRASLCALAAWLALPLAQAQSPAPEQAADSPLVLPPANNGPSQALSALHLNGELQLQATQRQASPRSPLALANGVQVGTAATPPSSTVAGAELKGRWQQVSANVWLQHERPEGGPGGSLARFNELQASADLGAWQFSAGRKIVSWDVGYGFRPNDLVQQEQRRTLLSSTPPGRPLLQAEWFNAEQSASLVWVNPRREQADRPQLGGDEQALAARLYSRVGALDAYAFARAGHDTGGSLGSALSWVAGDALELHASARWMARHTGWQFGNGSADAASPSLLPGNPWTRVRQGAASQGLLGAQWTVSPPWGLMVEVWHDGTAPTKRQWRAWSARNAGLAGLQPHLPAAARPALAGNLAWQTDLFDTGTTGGSLRQENAFVRLSWQPEGWLCTLDALYHPADRGRIVTAAVQWQGDRWRLNAAWRQAGGPADSVLVQLPTRRSLVLAATRAF